MDEQKIRVFVIEDEFFTFDSLRIFLSQDPRTVYVGGAREPRHAIKLFQDSMTDKRPEVILLDMRFRDAKGLEEPLTGIEIIKEVERLRQANVFDPKVLCLSMTLDPDIVLQALASGASGYLDKNQVMEGIIDAITLVHQGRILVSPNIGDRILQLVERGFVLFPEKPLSYLSERTSEVAFLYYRCGMSAKEIASELFIEESTVRTHIKRVKEVLNVTLRADAIKKLTGRVEKG